MTIVRIEEGGKVLVVDGTKLHLIDWDALCGCKVTFPEALDPAVVKALEDYETPLRRKPE